MEVDMVRWVLPDETKLTKLVEAMQKHNVTLEEALLAIRNYVNDRDFSRSLDEHYNNMVDDIWGYWHDGEI
jgi:enamine deaminase RidA (YjgF/YER057c/UK114 family)